MQNVPEDSLFHSYFFLENEKDEYKNVFDFSEHKIKKIISVSHDKELKAYAETILMNYIQGNCKILWSNNVLFVC
jgi:autonomous glycyl radical cofactor GrcA